MSFKSTIDYKKKNFCKLQFKVRSKSLIYVRTIKTESTNRFFAL